MNDTSILNRCVTDNNLNLYLCNDPKFKTVLVDFYLLLPLEDYSAATKNALLPYVLYRGSRRYPTRRDFIRRLEKMYGANLEIKVLKRGENQILRFSLEVVRERFLPGREDVLTDGLNLMNQLLFNPLVEGDKFLADSVNREKDNLAEEIKGLINNKYRYALERCVQEMCKSEPYSIYRLGNLEQLGYIDGSNLYSHYRDLTDEYPLFIFITGAVDEDEFSRKFTRCFPAQTPGKKMINKTVSGSKNGEVREIFEQEDVRQGRLTLGLRTGITRGDDLYYPLLVYNGILGSFPFSLLFSRVREEEGLAYYVSSRLESTKGLLFITAGIKMDKYEQTRDIIREIIRDMVCGDFSSRDLEWSKKGLINQYRGLMDNSSHINGYYLLGLINDRIESVSRMITGIRNVTREDIQIVARKIELDTIYFLADGEVSC